MRTRAGLVVLLLAAAVVVPASRGAAAQGLTAQPNTNLVDGDVVTIHGSGFPSDSSVAACEGIVDATPDSSDCATFVGFFTTDSSGSFTTQFAVRRFITPSSTGVMIDCADPSNPCGIGAAEFDTTFGPISSVTLAFRPQTIVPRPDIMVRNVATGQLYGDDVYSSSGNGVQTRRHLLVDGKWAYAVRVQNDGNEADDLIVKALVQTDVTYFLGYYNVTSAVMGSGLRLPQVAAGRTISLAVRGVSVENDIRDFAAIVTVTSGAAFELSDTVQLQYLDPRSR